MWSRRASLPVGKVGQQILHFVEFEELRLRGGVRFLGMADTCWQGLQHLRFPAGDVPEQCVQGGQALVAGPDVIGGVRVPGSAGSPGPARS